VAAGRDDPGWGPNSTFRFPASGGTGAIWKSVAGLIPKHHFAYRTAVTRIDTGRRTVRTEDGAEHPYDVLISTLPLDVLSEMAGADRLKRHSSRLRHSTTHVVGIGLAGRAPVELASKNWMYYPEGDCPFYRVTVFSNYSPRNVPDPSRFWSVMAEVSESPFKPVDERALAGDVIRGARATRLIRPESEIVSIWQKRLPHGYPLPSRDRDEHLEPLLNALDEGGIYSRGRFGAWKYEVANQDHTCMQGVEVVDRLLLGVPEVTLPDPQAINQPVPRNVARFEAAAGAPLATGK
jgi:protoporphyrinogen oxidase